MKSLNLPMSVVLGTLAVMSISSTQAKAALIISNTEGNNLVIFDENTGSFQGEFTNSINGGLRDPDDLTFGPDGNLYVSNGGSSSTNLLNPSYPTDSAVLRYSPTGEFLGVAAVGNGLTRPYGNAFSPDGTLYVSSFRTNQILKFDPTTGNFLGVFASDNNSGLGTVDGLNGPNDLLFGTDGSLYVTTQGSANLPNGDLSYPYQSQVLRYSPAQVAGQEPTTNPTLFIDQPVPLPESQGFVSFLGLVLAPNNDILVSDFAGGIRRYNPTGVLVDTLSTNYTGTTPSNNFIGNLTFGTGSSSNNLYVAGFDFTNQNIGSVLAYDGATGDSTSFTGAEFTNNSLVRSIGITAIPQSVPEPDLNLIFSLFALTSFVMTVGKKRHT
ncbi:PEP-CTERM sorting domain-containing protein [Nodularia sphaerocarpa]|uniref:Vgb family protein n=2 Tax=Nodularia sphaerocarpa TaxID=137816 RepID=UPI00232D6F26|nr:PEP-CTERM sorting domain-containing protein [Nodularia sphaerocarpa]MDB9375545.1 PEP-CTERM sorting domain-containing protein [Nodularia sphaerocarpa CS-585]MDB9379575.1 PEP-CTERM sorting domain-containing protein [Nodularia sphaerocarpa CS-585A2]